MSTEITGSAQRPPLASVAVGQVTGEAAPKLSGQKRKLPAEMVAKLDDKLVAKAVRAMLRKHASPASVSRKDLREGLERQLGQDLTEWKATIKDAAVAFVLNMQAA